LNLYDVFDFIARLGFPIFVASWFMLRVEGLIKENTRVTAGLAAAVTRLLEKMEHGAR